MGGFGPALKRKVRLLIGDIVTVTVDRPLGSYHPEYKDMYYPVNYGYIEGIMAPDGEEQIRFQEKFFHSEIEIQI